MKQINDDFHLISEKFLKDVLRQPPLDPDYWWEQNKSTSLKGTILITIEELREIWDHSAKCQVDKETEYANSINFNAYLTSKGIQL